jgi:Ca2+-binding RTX toxin-like protein
VSTIRNSCDKITNINGIGSDVDLTHWDVSHVSDAHKAFYSATTFNQDIGTNIIHGKRPIFNGCTKIKCDCIGSSTFTTTACNHDTLTGGTTDDILVGGAGNDTLKGAGGRDVFDYGFKNAGNYGAEQ